MFDNLSEKLGGILDRLTRRGSLTEADVDAAMREVRRALLEADVSLDVVRSFTEKVREQAIGATVVKSVTPGQMVVKIVHDELIATLGSDGQTIDFNAVPPVAIMMVGLQGSGKTTTTAKLARRLTQRDKRKVLLASLDIYRPAAMEQLAVLGRDLEIQTLPIVAGQKPVQIARRALEAGKLGGYDVVLLDTAGRTTLDEEMMTEAADIKATASPHEVLLVADALTGQDAVNLARAFDQRVGLTGIVLRLTGGDRHWAEDVVQETLLRAWRHADALRVGRQSRSLMPWLATVARRIVLNDRRNRSARPFEVDDAVLAGVGVADDTELALQRIIIREALARLTPAHRRVVVEMYLRGRSVQEVAHILGIPAGTVKSRLHHAMRAMRAAMQKRGVTR